MSTWCGAFVEVGERDFAALAPKYRLTILGPQGAWVYIHADVNFASIEPPRFAAALSAELNGTVFAFMLQTNASCEVLEHWERGELVRRLVCEEQRWKNAEGTPQAWESIYFFDSSEGTNDDEKWPLTLDRETSEENRLRYEQAKRANDPSAVLDLLRGGNVDSLLRLAKHWGIDVRTPTARHAARWKVRTVLALTLALVCGAALLGALWGRA